VGTTPGGNELFEQQTTGYQLSVIGIPMGSTSIYATLKMRKSGIWTETYYTYTSAEEGAAQIYNPANRSTLPGADVTFEWTDGGAFEFRLKVGTKIGGNDLYDEYLGRNLSTTVTNLPTDGSTIYVGMMSYLNGSTHTWYYNYTAASVAAISPTISPATGATLDGETETFTFSYPDATQYSIWIGSNPGANDIYDSAVTSPVTVAGLPTDGSALYLRLFAMVNGSWETFDYTYTAPAAELATMTSPADGATLSADTETFVFTDDDSSQYSIWIGSSLGANDIYDSAVTSPVTVSGLPVDGTTLYVRLFTMINGSLQFNDYSYTAYLQ
jgi:hypothetical protein